MHYPPAASILFLAFSVNFKAVIVIFGHTANLSSSTTLQTQTIDLFVFYLTDLTILLIEIGYL
tara:strand:- start:304 stop:492 length:189 start_codon:yes stop_codon:yes gene_type:complete